MDVVLKDLAAVQSDQANIIGHLTWYSLSEMLIKPEQLRQQMIRSGLGDGWMPNEIRVPDAFRRATGVKHRRQVSTGVYENYLCREVSSDKSLVQRNIVCETVDTKGKRLDYQGEAAVLVLDKKAGIVTVSSSSATADQIAREAASRFHLFCEHYSSSALRTVVSNILKSMSPTPVRPAGGVYFIPQQFENRLKSFQLLLRSLEKGEAEIIPLINTRDMKGMITRKLQEHLRETLRSCDEGAVANLPKGQVKEILNDAKRVVSDYKQYSSIVTGDLREMEWNVAQISEKVAAILQSIAS
jgi:hypothetical protein